MRVSKRHLRKRWVHPSAVLGRLFLFVTVVLQAIGFATTYWKVTQGSSALGKTEYEDRLGLWKWCRCVSDACFCLSTNEFYSEQTWFKGFQVCETMALTLLLVAVVTSILFIASTRMICLRWVILVSTLLSGVCITVGLLIFGVMEKYPRYFHFSFYLTILSSALSFITAGLLAYGLENAHRASSAVNPSLGTAEIKFPDVTPQYASRPSPALNDHPWPPPNIDLPAYTPAACIPNTVGVSDVPPPPVYDYPAENDTQGRHLATSK